MATPAPLKAGTVPKVKKPRRRIIVHRGFQFRSLIPVFTLAGSFAVLAAVFVFIPMNSHVAADPDPAVQALLGAQLFRIELWLAPLLAFCACTAAVMALLRSQRVAGPMHRLRHGLSRLAVGNAEPIKFRDGDEFRDLEAVYAGVVNRVDELTRGKLELLRFLRRNIEGLASRAESGQLTNDEIRESLAAVLRDVDAETKKIQLKA